MCSEVLCIPVPVIMSAMCVRERFFSHGSSSVRRKWSSQDTEQKTLIVIYNLSGDGPPCVDTYLALSTREELE